MKNKSFINRIQNGIREGWDLNLYPQCILNLEKNFKFKIIKILGALSVTLIVSGIAHEYFNSILFYIIFVYNILFILYRIFIMIIKIFILIKLIISNKFIIRNSPSDYVGTFVKLLFATAKTTGSAAFGTGLSLSLAKEMDNLLVDEGREPIFIPKIKDLIKSNPRLDNTFDTILNKIGATRKVNDDISINNSNNLNQTSIGRKSIELEDTVKIDDTVSKLNNEGVPITKTDINLAKDHFNRLNKEDQIKFLEEVNKKNLDTNQSVKNK